MYKKIISLHFLMIHFIAQSYDLQDKNFQKFAGAGIVVTSATLLTYFWATSGDTVEQRVSDAKYDLEGMLEYEQEFDIAPILGNKEAQIKKVLEQLNIDIGSIEKTYLKKLDDDFVKIKKIYNNLWFKSFYGGKEIAELTSHVYQIKIKIENLLNYLKLHEKFIYAHQIIYESHKLLHRNVMQNPDEIVKASVLYDSISNFPLYNYVKKIEKDLACINIFIDDEVVAQNYSDLSRIIVEYQPFLLEFKDIITKMELYKNQAFHKLECDILELVEKYKQLELKIKQLELDIAIANMRR